MEIVKGYNDDVQMFPDCLFVLKKFDRFIEQLQTITVVQLDMINKSFHRFWHLAFIEYLSLTVVVYSCIEE